MTGGRGSSFLAPFGRASHSLAGPFTPPDTSALTRHGQGYRARVPGHDLAKALVSLPFDLKVLLEAVADPDLEREVRELAAATVVHVITPKDGNVEAPLRSARTWFSCAWRWRRSPPKAAKARPRSASGSPRTTRFDEELKLFRQTLGDDIVDWLDSRWGAMLKAVYAKKKIAMFVDDEEVGTFLYDEGLRFGTLYPITREVAGGPGQAGAAVRRSSRAQARSGQEKDHFVGGRGGAETVSSMSRDRSGAPFGAEPSAVLRPGRSDVAAWREPPDPADHRRGARGGAAAASAAAGAASPAIENRDHGASTARRRAAVDARRGRAGDACCPSWTRPSTSRRRRGRRHKDVWEHTKQVVLQSVPEPIVRWAALLHDIGKVRTRVMLPDGKVTFHRHAEVGARMFEPIARRLGFDKPERAQDPLPDPEPPARQRVPAELDRRGRAPVRSRDGRAPRRPAGSVAAPT